ncbi:MAG TPA: signal peptidase I [Blastocatellia bacterium]
MSKRKRIFLIALAIILIPAAIFYFFFLQFVKVPTGSMSNTILPGETLIVNKYLSDVVRGDLIIFNYPGDPSIRYVSRVIGLPGETIEIRDNKVFINGQELAEHRVIVEPQYSEDPSPLKIISDEGGQTGWTVYYYKREEDDLATILYSDARYGAREPFRMPAKGDPIPEEVADDPKARRVYDSDGDSKYDSDQYFVLGDNRDNSQDSRYWGTVPRHFIKGKPFLIYWSADPSGDGKTRWDRVFHRVK